MMNEIPKLPANAPAAVHFKTEAQKRKFTECSMSPEEFKAATNVIMLKRGIDNKTRKQLIANLRYARKMTSEDWTKKAEEIKAAKQQ